MLIGARFQLQCQMFVGGLINIHLLRDKQDLGERKHLETQLPPPPGARHNKPGGVAAPVRLLSLLLRLIGRDHVINCAELSEC